MRGAHAATREAAEASPWARRASFASGFEEESSRSVIGVPIRPCSCFGFVAAIAAASATPLAFSPNLAMLLKAIFCSLWAEKKELESRSAATTRDAWSERKASAPATAATPWRRTSAARSLAPACVVAACLEKAAAKARAAAAACFFR